jgi:L-lactate dehydrogenase complex protein LldG
MVGVERRAGVKRDPLGGDGSPGRVGGDDADRRGDLMPTAASANARNLILGRIGEILGPRPSAADEYAGIVREYRQASSLDAAGRIALFVDRLQHYQVGVYRAGAGRLAEAVALALSARGRARVLVPPDVPRDWLPPSLDAVPDAGVSYAELDRSEGVLTGCSVAIASTGTIVLCHGRAEGRRALTLVPDYHLCVVFEDQIVETVPEAVRMLAASAPPLVTTISGPSATADIEMTRIKGVHGPRTLDVVIGV